MRGDLAKPVLAALTAVALLAGCSVDQSPDSSIEAVQAAAYAPAGAPKMTLFTMVNNRTGAGGHTSLMIDGAQRVLFDPAGSFRDERVVERGDVLYGMTPGWVQAYKSAHARDSFHVVTQEVPLTAAQAEQAIRLIQANGSVPGAFCTNATTGILRQIDGFGGISQTFYPVRLMAQIETLPNVRTDRYYENDAGDVLDGIRGPA